MVLKELILTVSILGGCGGLERTDLILTVSTLGGCGGLERTDFFNSFYYWEGVVVLKELILTASALGGCGGFERTHFQQFLHWDILKD